MTDQQIEKLLKRTRIIAVIGSSPDTTRSSNSISRRLLNLGKTLYPVNPNYEYVLDMPCADTMQKLPDDAEIDIALIFRNPKDAVESVKDIITFAESRNQIPVVWTQPGAHSNTAQNMAEAAGLEYIGDYCIAVEYSRLQGA